MQPIIKRYIWSLLLVFAVFAARNTMGFALIGPLTLANGADSWENTVLGYNYAYDDLSGFGSIEGGAVFLGDVGHPRNFAQEYRRDVPILYYSYDPTFLNFFGADGETANDQAFAIMDSVPAANKIDLSLYPDRTLQDNYSAQASFLTDLKSVTLHLLVEQVGLADAERFVFTLHNRDAITGVACLAGGEDYTVVSRNYDIQNPSPSQIVYSPYVNDNLYSYFIVELCTSPGAGFPTAFTVPFLPDPEASPYSAVSANNYDGQEGIIFLNPNGNQPTALSGGLQVGQFYSGLTKDDVQGLKYIYDTNNVNYEIPDPTSSYSSVSTNFGAGTAYFPSGEVGGGAFGTTTNGGFYTFDGTYGYGDYGALWATAQTNNAATLMALYPGLIVSSSIQYPATVTNLIFTQYFTNAGIGSTYPPTLTLVTVSNKQIVPIYKYTNTFANVFLYNVKPTTSAKLQTISLVPNTSAPYPAPPVTTVTTKNITLNVPSGGFFVLPLFNTNVCPIGFIQPQFTNVFATTNFLTATATNIVTSTNTSVFSSTLTQVTYFTNYIWYVWQVNCALVPNPVDYYQGNGGVKWVRHDYDSGFTEYFVPVTNYYNMVAGTNYQWKTKPFIRVVTQPDLILETEDFGLDAVGGAFVGTVERSQPNFVPSPQIGNLAGPGTIDSPSVFIYNEMGQVFRNNYFLPNADTTQFLGQFDSIPGLAWASFDASTNAPEVYPNWQSIENLQNQLVVNLSPSTLPAGAVGSFYSVQLNATGGPLSGGLSWTATGSPAGAGLFYGLPPGLSIAPSGTISGLPSRSGTYDFTVTVTDDPGENISPHVISWILSITIH